MNLTTTLAAGVLAASISLIPNESLREVPGKVDSIPSADYVYVLDNEGRSIAIAPWEGVIVGQNIKVIISDNGTPANVYDDFVKEVITAHRYFRLGHISANRSGHLTIDTEDGNRWEAYRPDAASCPIGTKVCLVLSNNFTPDDIRDDSIQGIYIAI